MSESQKYDVVIIGAGLSGMACAIRLRKKNKRVLILEKNEQAGGKLDKLTKGNFRWDKGPSLFTQPNRVDELFELWDKNPRDYFSYKRQSESCRYFFEDGTQLVFKDGIEQTIKEIGHEVDKNELAKLKRYVKTAKNDYEKIGTFFLDQKQPGFSDFLSREFIKRYPYFLNKRMRISLNTYNEQFEDKRLVKIFNRFGTYNGSNPYQMSGLYNMISSLEMSQGSYFPTEGMRSIPNALEKLAKEIGVDFIFNTNVKVVQNNEEYLVSNDSETYKASSVVCAIDHLTFYKKVINDPSLFEKYKKQERSTSGLVFYWGINCKIDGLGLHNILFNSNYEDEFDNLFNQQVCHNEPTLYIHVSSTISKTDAPENGHNLFIMINTPAYQNPDEAYRTQMKEYIINKIANTFNKDISNNIVEEAYWDNASIETRTGSFLGALYGASSNTKTAALSRHGNTSKKYPNLYFTGGTVHPGGGIPLVLSSAKIVADLIK